MEKYPEGPLVPLYRNPDLLDIAQNDALLHSRLEGLRIATETLDSSPGVDTFVELVNTMEGEVRGYVDEVGYQWSEANEEPPEQTSP